MKQLTLSGDSLYRGSLVLVNREHPFRETAGLPLVPVFENSTVLLERQAASLLHSLMEKIGGGWRHITPVSGWRSSDEQQEIWEESVRDRGLDFTRKFVAVPGFSEHQTGLAIDLGFRKSLLDYICPDFPHRGICQAFRRHAAAYGFIERYPAGKEDITGIGHEPWHFRYVGAPHARLMEENGLCLEEYPEFLRERPRSCPLPDGRLAQVFYVPCAGEETEIQLPDGCCQVSGDNAGGFIVTAWGRPA